MVLEQTLAKTDEGIKKAAISSSEAVLSQPDLDNAVTKAVSQSASPGDPSGQRVIIDKYTLFGELPDELQLQIWKAYISQPRVVPIVYLRRGNFWKYGCDCPKGCTAVHTHNTPVPAVLHVNKKARDYGLTHYKLILGEVMNRGPIYFNPKVDTLKFNSVQAVQFLHNLNVTCHDHNISNTLAGHMINQGIVPVTPVRTANREAAKRTLETIVQHVAFGKDKGEMRALDFVTKILPKYTALKTAVIGTDTTLPWLFKPTLAVASWLEGQMNNLRETFEEKAPRIPDLRFVSFHDFDKTLKGKKGLHGQLRLADGKWVAIDCTGEPIPKGDKWYWLLSPNDEDKSTNPNLSDP